MDQTTLTTLKSLDNKKPVQVIVRCIKANRDNPPHIKNFTQGIEYRKALIEYQKQCLEAPKDFLINQANNLGLTTSSASAINAILVTGLPETLITFIEGNPIESVLFNWEIQQSSNY